MFALTQFPTKNHPFIEAISAVDAARTPVLISGLGNVHKAHAVANFYTHFSRPVLLLVSDAAQMLRLEKDLSSLLDTKVLLYKGRELNLYPAAGTARELEQEKLNTLYAIAEGGAQIILTTPDALLCPVIPKNTLQNAVQTIKIGEEIDPHSLAEDLVNLGYSRTEQVEGMGQFSLRGGILDVFSPAYPAPLRLDFWGDTLDGISFFDPLTQRSNKKADEAILLPAGESLPALHPKGTAGFLADLHALQKKLSARKAPPLDFLTHLAEDIERFETNLLPPALDRYFNLLYPERANLLDYLPKNTMIFCSELAKLSEQANAFLSTQQEYALSAMEAGFLEGSLARFFPSWNDMFEKLSPYALIVMDQFTGGSFGVSFSPRAMVSILAKQLPSYGGSVASAENDIRHYVTEGFSTLVLCKDESRAKRLAEHLEKLDIPLSLSLTPTDPFPETGVCTIGVGNLSHGIEYPKEKIAIITEGQLHQTATEKKRKQPKKKGAALERYTDLSVGDLVVHEHHGIGRFLGIETMALDGIKKDYIQISYHGNDKLYLPVTQLDLISKYIGTGGEDVRVKLSRMGGTQWRETKAKAKGAAKDLAKGLIELYAARARQKGYAFSPDSPWQTEFEEQFPYTETDDQLTCTEEIKRDMERAIPMDRLLCGDVGYGKTEVALRAVMKCVLEGKQAAILVPTTVLAQQHYQTALARFQGFPMTIEVLSRYKTAGQAKKILEKAALGQVDLLIGTHKILQKSIQFKDLGLLIVDEEQRFGVTHKERLKEISKNIDVLTLSATPIPRTLNMALSGIRDMSTIEEPPQNRRPVQTYVLEHNFSLLRDAMLRELGRGGQVYYLHNRVETIDRTAVKIRELTDGANVVVAHGKMDEKHLSAAMESMISGEAQILVCTSIIETGIDIPNVNTLIIEDADHMGLAQLHQIRGRVGRSTRTSFAYLTYRPGKMLTEVATKRLAAIQEFVAFNSGFKIALRDLEIRGAGNILGREQSGHMMSVGYDMYLKLLNEAVLEEKGEPIPQKTQCTADLIIEANIPANYVPLPEQRMDLYRRIANIRCEKDAKDVMRELKDRFGKPPNSVLSLIEVAKLRGRASEIGITEMVQKSGCLRFSFLPDAPALNVISTIYERAEFAKRVRILAGDVPKMELQLMENRPILEQADEFIRFLAQDER